MMKAANSLASRGSKLLAGETPFRLNGGALHQSPAPRRRRLEVQDAVKEVFMPALSSTMTEGKIVSWLKSEGDEIKKGEAIVVVESDKADMDVESFNDGFLGSIVVPEGGVANVGEAIAFIAEQEAEMKEAKAKAGGAAPAAKPAEAEAPPPPSPPTAKPEENAAPDAKSAPAPPPPAPAPAPVAAAVARTDGRIIATPYAKKLAKQLKVDLAVVAGSGPAGRITAADVQAATSNGAKAPVAAPAKPAPSAPPAGGSPAPAAPPPAASTTVSELRGTTEPMSTMQLSVAQNMVNSLQVPEFRVSMKITTDDLDALYQTLKPHGVTMTTLLAKACGVALAQHPLLFSSCTPDGKGITYNEHVNVAVAVAMPDGGLITPVLKDCDTTDIYTLSRDWRDLVKRSRAKKLAPDEYNSGTFTLSNLGMFGVESFDAILPFGSSAILGIAGSQPCVVATEDGMICVKKQMTVNMTCDHRVVYGAQAAEFLQTLKGIIESPELLTL
ncbi:unnamed protein product [Ostreobium quekettii]|uniref:Dihydrolipoamide acetyltransferase component of pyruvate dehydrogenase complex n=1 Tax=Ostreobium quekettii TaxID=121088 RepID=A0A8S1J6H4_9CHLO|nr:unnamed protein product [Ostreobium quekettii]